MSCPNDTDHDGDCHLCRLCHRLPGGCFLRGIITPGIHCGSSISKTEVLFSGSTDPSTRGFTALPEHASGRTCWQILGLLDARQQTRESIIAAYRARAPQCHPDTGGSHDAFAELNTAREQALASI